MEHIVFFDNSVCVVDQRKFTTDQAEIEIPQSERVSDSRSVGSQIERVPRSTYRSPLTLNSNFHRLSLVVLTHHSSSTPSSVSLVWKRTGT
jgi:hypothetical protein